MKFSVGDVVAMNQMAIDQRWHECWHRLNGNGPYAVAEIVDEGEEDEAAILTHLDGSPVQWDQFEFGSDEDGGVNIEYLDIQPFLTAARKAIAHEAR